MITCRIPPTLQAGNFSVSVKIGNQVSSEDIYGVNLLPPVIAALSGLGGLQGPALGNTPISLVVEDLFEFTSVNF